MLELIVFASAGVVVVASHFKIRQYTRTKLRFVDVVQNPVAPVIAGAAAAVVAAPVVWLLPFVGAGTAILFGIGIGSGVALGAKDVKRLPGE